MTILQWVKREITVLVFQDIGYYCRVCSSVTHPRGAQIHGGRASSFFSISFEKNML
uniref:Uncharacterized protein n=1 Tax=Aquilaria malaccensis TaxID=223753 RepID=A0A4Y6GMP8_9ROSI|nr:hypothetical protein [Aquilaria malaccensis]